MLIVKPVVVGNPTPDTVKLEAACPFCGKINSITVNREEYEDGLEALRFGMLVQDAFPNWSPDQREFMMTSNCKCLWG